MIRHSNGHVPCRALAALAALSALLGPAAAAAVLRVDSSLAGGANDGTSWADAFRGAGGLRAALAASAPGDEIWVKAGTYTPHASDRSASLELRDGVAVYGGFAGGETSLRERDPAANATILSGDLMGNDGPGGVHLEDNSFHVVSAAGLGPDSILDGFTITAGNADGDGGAAQDRGGGLLCQAGGDATLRACVFQGSRAALDGGGACVHASSPTFLRCEFSGNAAGLGGGAVRVVATSSPVILDCRFHANQAAQGGAVAISGGGTPALTNCAFWHNEAVGLFGGGAMVTDNGNLVAVRNCTFAANSASFLAGGINNNGTTSIANCIFWMNAGPGGTGSADQITTSGGVSVAWSLVQGGFAGVGNRDADPLFVDLGRGDLHLQAGLSPAIDAGSNSSVPAGITWDLDGNPRVVEDACIVASGSGVAPFVDLGAYESQGVPCVADLDGNAQVNGADLGLLVGNWGGSGTGDLDGNGIVNGADLGVLIGGWGPCCP